MFIPKSIVFDFNSKSIYLDISKIKRALLVFSLLWCLIIIAGAVAKLGVLSFIEARHVNALKNEYAQVLETEAQLKNEYNQIAEGYIEERKIVRVVSSVNQWLTDDQLLFWAELIRENGLEIFQSLNDESLRKLRIQTNQYSIRTGVSLLLAIAALESDFNLYKASGKGAYGPMQLKRITAKQIGLKSRKNPADNIRGGTRYLISMLEKYNSYPDQLELALASYNAGVTRVKREWISTWGDDWNLIHAGLSSGNRFKETRNYVSTIIAMSRLFSSGKWSDLDEEFWSNYRRYIFESRFASIYSYETDDPRYVELEGSSE